MILLLGLVGCAGGPVLDSGSETGLVCVAQPLSRVQSGTATTGFEGVVAVNEVASSFCERTGRPICTGTVISPRTVLTAAHCEDNIPARLLGIVIGPRSTYGVGPVGDQLEGVWFGVAEVTVHPDATAEQGAVDLMLLHFDQDLPVTPVPTLALDDTFVGAGATVVGFGGRADGELWVKQEGTVVVESIDPGELRYTPDPAMTCSGDSGGPVLFDVDGTWHIGAVTARGDAECRTHGIGPRVDANLGFLAAP